MKRSLFITPLFLLLAIQANALVSIEGRVHELDPSTGNVIIKENTTGALHLLRLNEDSTVHVNNERLNDLSSLSVGENVVYKKTSAVKSIKYITARIQELDTDNREVTFVDTKTGEVQTYAYDPQAIKVKSRRDIDVSRIKPGQKVELQVVIR